MRVAGLVPLAALIALLALAPSAGALSPVVLPADEAAHPSAKSERWELAGHLKTATDRTFGLLAAFRRGKHQTLGKGSLLTFAVVDVDGGLLYADVNLIKRPSSERAPKPLLLAWEGSYLQRLPDDGGLRLLARGVDDQTRRPMAADLVLKGAKPSALLGEAGRRPLGSTANTSFRHATSRMEAHGNLVLEEVTYPVTGHLWFTHLWGRFDGTGKAFDGSTTWTAHLSDGRDLHIEAFRGVKKGEPLPPVAAWLGEDGSVREEALKAPPEVTNRWRSIRGMLYPTSWRIPVSGGELACRARLPNGEVLYQINLFFVRWTSFSWVGSCNLEGTIDGQPVSGEAIVEATGFTPPK